MTERWWRGGWGGTFRRVYRGGSTLGGPDVTRLCVIVGSISLLSSFCRLVGVLGGLALYALGAVCWAAHRRAKLVDWINDWAAKND